MAGVRFNTNEVMSSTQMKAAAYYKQYKVALETDLAAMKAAGDGQNLSTNPDVLTINGLKGRPGVDEFLELSGSVRYQGEKPTEALVTETSSFGFGGVLFNYRTKIEQTTKGELKVDLAGKRAWESWAGEPTHLIFTPKRDGSVMLGFSQGGSVKLDL